MVQAYLGGSSDHCFPCMYIFLLATYLLMQVYWYTHICRSRCWLIERLPREWYRRSEVALVFTVSQVGTSFCLLLPTYLCRCGPKKGFKLKYWCSQLTFEVLVTHCWSYLWFGDKARKEREGKSLEAEWVKRQKLTNYRFSLQRKKPIFFLDKNVTKNAEAIISNGQVEQFQWLLKKLGCLSADFQ